MNNKSPFFEVILFLLPPTTTATETLLQQKDKRYSRHTHTHTDYKTIHYFSTNESTPFVLLMLNDLPMHCPPACLPGCLAGKPTAGNGTISSLSSLQIPMVMCALFTTNPVGVLVHVAQMDNKIGFCQGPKDPLKYI